MAITFNGIETTALANQDDIASTPETIKLPNGVKLGVMLEKGPIPAIYADRGDTSKCAPDWKHKYVRRLRSEIQIEE